MYDADDDEYYEKGGTDNRPDVALCCDKAVTVRTPYGTRATCVFHRRKFTAIWQERQGLSGTWGPWVEEKYISFGIGDRDEA
jgi:hypothetical protein